MDTFEKLMEGASPALRAWMFPNEAEIALQRRIIAVDVKQGASFAHLANVYYHRFSEHQDAPPELKADLAAYLNWLAQFLP